MAKYINPQELAEIVTNLLTNPSKVGEDMTETAYSQFMTSIAETVCDACGGEVEQLASPDFDSNGKIEWFIGIIKNDSLPDGGGIWAGYEPFADLNPSPEPVV